MKRRELEPLAAKKTQIVQSVDSLFLKFNIPKHLFFSPQEGKILQVCLARQLAFERMHDLQGQIFGSSTSDIFPLEVNRHQLPWFHREEQEYRLLTGHFANKAKILADARKIPADRLSEIEETAYRLAEDLYRHGLLGIDAHASYPREIIDILNAEAERASFSFRRGRTDLNG